MNKNSKSKAKGRNPRQKSIGSLDPPQLDTQPTFFRKLRYIQIGDSQKEISLLSDDLFNALGYMTFTSDGLSKSAIAYTVKVKKIEIWAAPKSDSDGAWQHASIDWHNSTSFASGKKVSDVSISNARPLHVVSKPPRDSVCNFWMQNGGIQYVTISVPVGAIVDIDVSYTMADNATHSSTGSTFHPPGYIFYDFLDNTTGGFLQPTDLKVDP
jgi:hypothetical protein